MFEVGQGRLRMAAWASKLAWSFSAPLLAGEAGERASFSTNDRGRGAIRALFISVALNAALRSDHRGEAPLSRGFPVLAGEKLRSSSRGSVAALVRKAPNIHP